MRHRNVHTDIHRYRDRDDRQETERTAERRRRERQACKLVKEINRQTDTHDAALTGIDPCT